MSGSQDLPDLDSLQPLVQPPLQDLLTKDKWSVVEVSKGEFDCIPNKWFQTLTTVYYYTKDYTAAAATKLARNLEDVPADWEIIPVKLKKRNFSSFDKGMEKAVAYCKDSESSDHERGVGLRKVKPVNRLSPDVTAGKRKKSNTSANDCEETESVSSFEGLLSPPKELVKPLKERQNIVRQISFTLPKVSANGKRPAGKTSPSKKSPVKEKPKKSEEDSSSSQCILKKKKLKHKCAFEIGPVSTTSITQGLCIIARFLEAIYGEIKCLKELNLNGQDEEEENGVDSDDETYQSVKQILPFYTVSTLLAFDKQLCSNQEICDILQKLIRKKASTTNPSICAKSLVKPVISKSLSKHLVWKGQSGEKQGFAGLKFNSLVIKTLKKLYPKLKDADKVVETAVSRWLTSTASNIKKGRDKSDTPIKNPNPDGARAVNKDMPSTSFTSESSLMDISEASDDSDCEVFE